MKYIIAGKNDSAGIVGDDSSSLSSYFELGWEVVGSRLDIIKLLKLKLINNDETTIVTIEDRMFMYSSFCKNVISWESFKIKLKNKEITASDIIDDWTVKQKFSFLDTKNCDFWENRDPRPESNSRYSRHDEDYDLIVNGFEINPKFLQNIKESKYYVANLRFRDHDKVRSSPKIWWSNLLHNIVQKKSCKVFLVGYGSDQFAIGDNMIYVPRLQDYVALIQDTRCAGILSTPTGTCLLAYCASKAPIHLIDHSNASINENIAVMGGKCSQFLKEKIYRYNSSDINQLGIEKIIQNLR